MKKEEFIRSNKPIFAAGEEDLLAFYLKSFDKNGEHVFLVPLEATAYVIEEGHWEDFEHSPERLAQVEANKISYAWDYLLETFIKHAVEDTQFFATHPGIRFSEQVFRFLAREARIFRRMLASALIDLIERTPNHKRGTRYIVHPRGNLHYVFLVFPQLEFMKSYEEYRQGRHKFLEACCLVTKLKFPEAQDIVGIATEPSFDRKGRSEDALYFDAREWTPEMEAEARELQEKLGLLENPTMYRVRDDEYPIPTAFLTEQARNPNLQIQIPPKFPRNKPCPCGSGIKYKFCHGKTRQAT